jgi:ferredoxin-NADP reductase
MARATVLGRLTWQAATVAEVRAESAVARTLVLDVPGWTGHVAGQHVDVRLTAEDGYTAQRSYSIASAPDDGRLELTVQFVDDGEVSPYLVEVAQPGDLFELRGPVGGYFTWVAGSGASHAGSETGDAGTEIRDAGTETWDAGTEPVLLVAGGSGIVPLMSMIRARKEAGSRVPFRLIYSVRTPEAAIYADELRRRVRDDRGLDVSYAYTRKAPADHPRPPGRLDAALLAAAGWPADLGPACFVCGPTGFVEAAADLLVDQGHPAERIKTERFGPTG